LCDPKQPEAAEMPEAADITRESSSCEEINESPEKNLQLKPVDDTQRTGASKALSREQ